MSTAPMFYQSLKKIPTQERGRKRVTDILDACEELMGETNHQDLSLAEIAEQANVSIGTVYHFFPDKDAIFVCLIERTLGEVLIEFEQSMDASLSLIEALRILVSRLEELWVKRDTLHVLYRQFQPRPDLAEMLNSISRQAIKLLKEQIRNSVPGLSEKRALRISRNLYWNMLALLDTCADVPAGQVPGLMEEWWVMIEVYVATINSN